MIGIFIFSLGLISIYALLASSINVNSYNKNAVIAWNLAREQIELIKNLRDSNYENLKKWNIFSPSEEFAVWRYYRIFVQSGDVMLEDITTANFPEWKDTLTEMWNMSASGYRVCLKNKKEYIYCPATLSPDTENTIFYKYISIEQSKGVWGVDIQDAFIVKSKVIWYHRWYHEYEVKTLITDWRRI